MKTFKQLIESLNDAIDEINHKGELVPTKNSEGHRIHPSEQGIRNFHDWFNGSVVKEPRFSSRDTSIKRPLVLYHGTKNDFHEFNPSTTGTVSHTFGSYQTKRHGIYLTPHKEFASSFSQAGETNGGHVMPVYASIKNPIDISNGFESEDIEKLKHHGVSERFMENMKPHQAWEHLDGEDGEHLVSAFKSAGYDGVKMSEDDHDTGEARDVYVAFHPHQVKSALGNNGQFSKNSGKITESKV